MTEKTQPPYWQRGMSELTTNKEQKYKEALEAIKRKVSELNTSEKENGHFIGLLVDIHKIARKVLEDE